MRLPDVQPQPAQKEVGTTTRVGIRLPSASNASKMPEMLAAISATLVALEPNA